jgi:hypothetical protein
MDGWGAEVSITVDLVATIVKDAMFDVPPRGVGLKTVTFTLPAADRSFLDIAAVSFVLLTYVVVRSLPFQRTTEVAIKLVPVIVSVKSGAFTAAEVGLMLVIVGTGLLTVCEYADEVLPEKFVSPL